MEEFERKASSSFSKYITNKTGRTKIFEADGLMGNSFN